MMGTPKSTADGRPVAGRPASRLCRQQYRYSQHTAAEAAARRWRRQFYHCVVCQGWHVRWLTRPVAPGP
jgi:hypothetical protein